MGSRGPAPTPTKLKVLRGETRPSRLNHSEPRPRAHLPTMPADMAEGAKVVWRRELREYGATGVVTGADADIFRAYCETVARYEHAGRLLDQSGPLVVARGTGARRGELVKNPLHQVVRDNVILMRALARELGLTPAARTGLRGNQEPERDPFADFLDGGA